MTKVARCSWEEDVTPVVRATSSQAEPGLADPPADPQTQHLHIHRSAHAQAVVIQNYVRGYLIRSKPGLECG